MSPAHEETSQVGVARRAIGGSFATSSVILLINTGTGVLLARSLGPTDRGVLAAALLWPTIAAVVGTLGLVEATMYHVARRTAPIGTVVGSGLWLAAMQSVVFTILGAALIRVALSSHHSSLIAAYMYIAFIPVSIGSLFGGGVLNGLQRYTEFQGVRLLVIVATALGLGGLALADQLTVRHAVIAYLAANVLTLAVTTIIVRRHSGPLRPDRHVVRAVFAYGIRSHSSTVSWQLNERLDQLVISIFLASRSLGIYVIAVTMTSATYLVGGSVSWIALPQIAPLAPGPERTALVRRTVQLTVICSILISVPVFVLATPLVQFFFGAPFVRAAEISRILLVAVVFLGTNRVLEAVLRALGRPLDAGLAELLALGATVVGLATLLPTVGLNGAAIASLIAYGVSTAWMCRRITRELPVSFRRLATIDRDDVAWLCSALSAPLHRRRRPSPPHDNCPR